jgi:putative oxidoreductase
MNRALRWVYHGSRLVLGGLFLYAGALKAGDVTAFAQTIGAYRIFPPAGNILVAVTLPYVEILAGILLVLNARVRPAALLLGTLTSVFILVLLSVIVRGVEVNCGCFGAADKASPTTALARDAVLLLLAAATYRLRGQQQG